MNTPPRQTTNNASQLHVEVTHRFPAPNRYGWELRPVAGLLSVASARDFGWIGTLEAVERLEATLTTMARLAKHRGHFYNWYDTRDLRPLDPQYVSSVDSGNLAGHLIALANACREWCDVPLAEKQRFQGVADALDLLRDEARRLRQLRQPQAVSWRRLDDEIEQLAAKVIQGAAVNAGFEQRIAALSEQAGVLADTAREIVPEEHDCGGADLKA